MQFLFSKVTAKFDSDSTQCLCIPLLRRAMRIWLIYMISKSRKPKQHSSSSSVRCNINTFHQDGSVYYEHLPSGQFCHLCNTSSFQRYSSVYYQHIPSGQFGVLPTHSIRTVRCITNTFHQDSSVYYQHIPSGQFGVLPTHSVRTVRCITNTFYQESSMY